MSPPLTFLIAYPYTYPYTYIKHIENQRLSLEEFIAGTYKLFNLNKAFSTLFVDFPVYLSGLSFLLLRSVTGTA